MKTMIKNATRSSLMMSLILLAAVAANAWQPLVNEIHVDGNGQLTQNPVVLHQPELRDWLRDVNYTNIWDNTKGEEDYQRRFYKDQPMITKIVCGDESQCFTNLCPGTEYEWSVGGFSGKFTTERQAPRTLLARIGDGRFGYVRNFRDLGGLRLIGSDRRTNYGVYFRSEKWEKFYEKNQREGNPMHSEFGIRSEIDLRRYDSAQNEIGAVIVDQGKNVLPEWSETTNTLYTEEYMWNENWFSACCPSGTVFRTSPAMPSGDESVRYFRCSLWEGCMNSNNNSQALHNVQRAFSVLGNQEMLPSLFHCASGKDRTGFVAMFIEALCGVREADIRRDYLLSQFSGVGYPTASYDEELKGQLYRENEKYNDKYDYGEKYGPSLAGRVRSYLERFGVTYEQIRTITTNLTGEEPQEVLDRVNAHVNEKGEEIDDEPDVADSNIVVGVPRIGTKVANPDVLARGGDEVYCLMEGGTKYYVHYFTDSTRESSFVNNTDKPLDVRYLVVGGGSAGGDTEEGRYGGVGGNGGAVAQDISQIVANASWTIRVGAGGTKGISGGDSLIASGDLEIVNAVGGKVADGEPSSSSRKGAAGGRGAGGDSLTPADFLAGDGGSGVWSDITGIAVMYGAGGGAGGGTATNAVGKVSLPFENGGDDEGVIPGDGANGGGRGGAYQLMVDQRSGDNRTKTVIQLSPAQDGVFATGGGGGGAGGSAAASESTLVKKGQSRGLDVVGGNTEDGKGVRPGNGGSGVVIIRYAAPDQSFSHYSVTFSTNGVQVGEEIWVEEDLTPTTIPSFDEIGYWEVDPTTAVIVCNTNFNYIIPTPESELPTGPQATGGEFFPIEQNGTPYYVHVFSNTTEAAAFVNTSGKPLSVEYLVVGGGGAGGGSKNADNGSSFGGGGGGAGCVVTSTTTMDASAEWSVVVGAGSIASVEDREGCGGTSYIKNGEEDIAIAPGGGNGALCSSKGWSGGDGIAAGGGASGKGDVGSGKYPGGKGATHKFSSSDENAMAGGGGGAGSQGEDAVDNDNANLLASGNGGDGVALSITGEEKWYGAGGGGGGGARKSRAKANYFSDAEDGNYGVKPGEGGKGGGGKGGDLIHDSEPGEDGTGSGGGGAGGKGLEFDSGTPERNVVGGNGGSGIVVIRYAAKPVVLWEVAFFTNDVQVGESIKVADGQSPSDIPDVSGGFWDVDPTTAVINCNTNFYYRDIPTGPQATGGEFFPIEQNGTPYYVHVFSNTAEAAAFVNTSGKPLSVEYLVVGGGGAGGASGNMKFGGGGGGGGAVVSGQGMIGAFERRMVIVGKGGVAPASSQAREDATASSIEGIVSAEGGGAGSCAYSDNGATALATGGGAGGSNGEHNDYYDGVCSKGAVGSLSKGGDAGEFDLVGDGMAYILAGGGGGAGGDGETGDVSARPLSSGNGGNGVVSDITGDSVVYGGGGGGGGGMKRYWNIPQKDTVTEYGIDYGKGVDGGGNGGWGYYSNGEDDNSLVFSPAQDGVPASGGGGGGAGAGVKQAGNGGSGIVVIRYAAKPAAPDKIGLSILFE